MENRVEEGTHSVVVNQGARAMDAPVLSRPRLLFLAAAGLSFLMSISLFFTGDHERGIYVGIWVPSILSAGTLLMGNENNART
jgi:hypothetical protein